jgi:hypothetical protein
MTIEKKTNDEFFGFEICAKLLKQRSCQSDEVSEAFHAVHIIVLKLQNVSRNAFHHDMLAVNRIELSAERATCLAERMSGNSVPYAICRFRRST